MPWMYRILNLHSHDLRVPVGSVSRFKLSLSQCDLPGVLNCMSGRLSGFPSLYCRYLCISYENDNYCGCAGWGDCND